MDILTIFPDYISFPTFASSEEPSHLSRLPIKPACNPMGLKFKCTYDLTSAHGWEVQLVSTLDGTVLYILL